MEEVKWWVRKEVDTKAQLKAANELLLQRDREFKAEQQKAESERAELEKKQCEEIISVEDSSYTIFE